MRILIVDDDRPYAVILAERLKRLEPSLQPDIVTSAEEARRIVSAAETYFDVFLVDHRLDGSDVDGITLMLELKGISNESDTIVLTGRDDAEIEQRASREGAYWYLNKLSSTWDLIHVLRRLSQERSVRFERNWLQILNDIAAQTQQATTVKDVARAIVQGAQRLDFQRARLRLFSDDEDHAEGESDMVCVCQAGNTGLEGFEGLRQPFTTLFYSREAIEAGEPKFFHNRELGEGELDRQFAGRGFRAPVGDWVKIPLLSGGRAIGSLSLDNGDQDCTFDEKQRSLLGVLCGLYGKQAAAALERARLQEQAEVQAREARILSEIGRQVTIQATRGNLDDLLDQVRTQVGTLMKVDNFMITLLDDNGVQLDFRRQYENGALQPRHWRSARAGINGHLLAQNHSLWVVDTKNYRKRHGIVRYGTDARCWLGVVLRVDRRAVGTMVVQDYSDPNTYSKDNQRLLVRVAEHVAGAIQMAYYIEREEERSRSQRVLQKLNRKLPQLARENELQFWHAVLTAITHHDGFSFNRALLFWYDESGSQLQGLMGIGHWTRADARKSWEQGVDEEEDFDQYLARLDYGLLVQTPIQEAISTWRLSSGGQESPLYKAWKAGEQQLVLSVDLRPYLPHVYTDPPDLLPDVVPYQAALIPVRAGTRTAGLLVLDNAFDGEPLRGEALDQAEEFVRQAALDLFQSRERHRMDHKGVPYEAILRISQQITLQASQRPLKECLESLCREAQGLTRADCVIIYPLRSSGASYEIEQIAAVGLLNEMRATDKPRQQGVAAHILRSGALVVPDVAKEVNLFDGRRLSQHGFMMREKIRALIGVPMRAAHTGEPLGVMYLNYRQPRLFSDQDIDQVERIANVGAVVISSTRARERETQSREAAEAREQRRKLELQNLRNIQEEALAPDADERKVIKTVLKNVVALFERAVLVCLAIKEWEHSGEVTKLVRREHRIKPPRRLSTYKEKDAYDGIIGAALASEKPQLHDNCFAFPVSLGTIVIGALYIELPASTTFTTSEQNQVERVATAIALALDNVRRYVHLKTVVKAIGAVADPNGLEETLEAVARLAHEAAPDLSCVTLWYKNTSGVLVAGPQWGVHYKQHRRENARSDRVVDRMMRRRRPIFASAVDTSRSLLGAFVRDEEIVSAAAFPLRFGKDPAALGALFFNYRHPHVFTDLERRLFRVFAEAAATSIHDAKAVETAEYNAARFKAAVDVSEAVGTRLDRDDVLRQTLATLRNHFRAKNAIPYVMLYEDLEDVLEMPPVAKEFYNITNEEYKTRFRLPLNGSGITCRVARKSKKAKQIVAEYVADVRSDSDYVEANADTQAELCAGLVSNGRLLGVLVLKSDAPAAFDDEDAKLLLLVAHQIAVALDRAEQAAHARRTSAIAGAMAWAADVAHDINSEVGYIRNRAYWLSTREVGLSAEGRLWTTEIDARALQLADTARTASSEQMKRTPFVVSDMLHEKTIHWQKRYSPNVDVGIESGCTATLHAPKEQVWRAIRQLLRNASEAMNGSSAIKLHLLYVGTDQLEIQIEDTGPGVPVEVRQRIFREPYSTKDHYDQGFGLLIAQSLIESMGGSIYLLPQEPAHGAVFAIRLPLAIDGVREEEHVNA